MQSQTFNVTKSHRLIRLYVFQGSACLNTAQLRNTLLGMERSGGAGQPIAGRIWVTKTTYFPFKIVKKNKHPGTVSLGNINKLSFWTSSHELGFVHLTKNLQQ